MPDPTTPLPDLPVSEDDYRAYQADRDQQAMGAWATGLSDQDAMADWAGALHDQAQADRQQAGLQRDAAAAARQAATRTYDTMTAGTDEMRDWAGGLYDRGQPSTDVGGTDWRAYAAQAAQRAGIDPGLFQRQIQAESGFDPNAKSGAGAVGIAQIVPSAHPGVNPLDPKASLDYAATWMRSLVDRYGGDVRKALAAYNAGPGAVDQYGGVPPFAETQRYVKTIYDDAQAGGSAGALAPPPVPGGEASALPQQRAPGRVEALGQFEQGLPYQDAASICGPVAALAFAQANGRNPDLAEARRLATQVGWTSEGGMNGVANEQKLLTAMGVPSRLDTNPDVGHIAQDAANGNPVIISTPVHYYYASDYDPNTGKLYVGKTGTARKGGGSWMTPEQISQLDGGINGALFVDNPQSPAPSVGVADTAGDRPESEFEPPSAFTPDAAALEQGIAKGYTGQPDAVVDEGADRAIQTPDRPPFGMPAMTPFGAVPTLPPIVPPNVSPPGDREQQRVAAGLPPIKGIEDITGAGAARATAATTAPLAWDTPQNAIKSIATIATALTDTGLLGQFFGRQLQSEPSLAAEVVRPGAAEEAEQAVAAQEARGGTGGGPLGAVARGAGEVAGDAGALGGGETAAQRIARTTPEELRQRLDETGESPLRTDFFYHAAPDYAGGPLKPTGRGGAVWLNSDAPVQRPGSVGLAIDKSRLDPRLLDTAPNGYPLYRGEIPADAITVLGPIEHGGTYAGESLHGAFRAADAAGAPPSIPPTTPAAAGPPPLPAGGPARTLVPDDPFVIRPGQTAAATAGDIRTELSGMRNAQIVRGNQLADRIRSLAPDEQGALFWAHEAGNDPATLRAWAQNPDPTLDPYRADIQAAEHLSPDAQQALALGQRYYDEAGQAGLDAGSLRTVRDNYQSRIYAPEPPQDAVRAQVGGGVGQSTYHARQRVYDTAYDAVLGGKTLATTDYADTLGVHNEEMARVNANRAMTTAMADSGLGKWVRPDNVPDGWQQVGALERNVPIKDANGDPVLGQDGNQLVSHSVFAAPEGIAKGLAAVADPSVLNRVDALRTVGRYQGLVKTVDLSLSAFHHFTMAMQGIYQTVSSPSSLADLAKNVPTLTKTLTSGAFQGLEQDFVRSGGMTTKVEDVQDVLRGLRPQDDAPLLQRIGQLPGVKQASAASQASSAFLFDRAQRYLKVMDYQNKVAGWVAAHPQATDDAVAAAKRGFAREVNAAYGGLNWEQMGVSKDGLRAMRLALLAPDWTVSNLAMGKYALQGGTAGASARAHIASALAVGTLLTQGTNYLLTGHSTLQNPKGHETEVEIAPGVYTSFYRGGIGDLLKLVSMVGESGPGGVARFAQGKLSPVLRTGVGLAANVDYAGHPIYGTGHMSPALAKMEHAPQGPLQSTLSTARYVGSSLLPIPLGLSTLYKYATSGQATPAGVAGVLSGVGRYSPGGQPRVPAYTGPARSTGPPKPPAPPRAPGARR